MTTADAAEASWTGDTGELQAPVRWGLLRIAGHSLLVAVVYFGAQVLALVGLGMAFMLSEPDADLQAWFEAAPLNGDALVASSVMTCLLCVPFVRFLAGKREARPWAFLGWAPAPWRTVGTWCLVLLVFVALSDALTVALGRPVIPPFMNSVYGSTSSTLGLLVALVIAAPLLEEILFRGFLLGSLSDTALGPWVAVFLSSAMWAGIHTQYDLYGIGTVFVMGLFFGSARLQSRSLAPPLAMHGLANMIACGQVALM